MLRRTIISCGNNFAEQKWKSCAFEKLIFSQRDKDLFLELKASENFGNKRHEISRCFELHTSDSVHL